MSAWRRGTTPQRRQVSDRSIELADQGIDDVRVASQIYFLDANVENMTMLLPAGPMPHGNELDNVIRGGAGNDDLYGSAASTLLGNGGDDLIDGSGLLRGGIGRDWLTAFGEVDRLYGDGGDDR